MTTGDPGFTRADVEALRDDLLAFLRDVDWVMFGGMAGHARDVTTIRDEATVAALVKTTLREFLDHPDAALLDGPMRRFITTRAELDELLTEVWPGPTALPDDDLAGWLVERGYEIGTTSGGGPVAR